MNSIQNFKLLRYFILITIPVILILIVLSVFVSKYRQLNIKLTFNIPSDVYSFQELEMNYLLENKLPAAVKTGLLKFSLCGQNYSNCRDLQKTDVKLGTGSINNKVRLKLDPQYDFGTYNLVLSLYEKDNSKLLAQMSKPVNINRLSDELYMNLITDKEIVSDGDYVKIKYTFINNSKIGFPKSEYALTVNFAGPLEIVQGKGQLVEDVSTDIPVGQTMSGDATWVIKDYTNRQGGLFNVSLLLSQRNEKGELVSITSAVKQVRWP